MFWQHVVRTLLIYVLVLAVTRLMGKREIGQLSPSDFVVAIMIAELAALPMESDAPLWHSLTPLLLLAALEIMIAYLSLHSRWLRHLINGRPQMVIANGLLVEEEMRRARYNLDDLLGQLREKGYTNIEDVEVGILETSGKLSIIPKSQKRPVTPADLHLPTSYEGLPTLLVMDGKILRTELDKVGLDEVWLQQQLQARGLQLKEVLLATLGTDGHIFVNPRTRTKLGQNMENY